MVTHSSPKARVIRHRPYKRQLVSREADHTRPTMCRLYMPPRGEHCIKIGADSGCRARFGFCTGKHAATHAKKEPAIWHQTKVVQQMPCVIGHLIRRPSGLTKFILAHRAGHNYVGLARQIAVGQPAWHIIRGITICRQNDLIRLHGVPVALKDPAILTLCDIFNRTAFKNARTRSFGRLG